MIDIEASVSSWQSCFAAFWGFCLRSGKRLTRRANREHKEIVAEFANARSGNNRCGHFAVAAYGNQQCATGSHALCDVNMDVDTSGKSAA
jgi:uncharacterized membrane protein